jgi:hypothetical protein
LKEKSKYDRMVLGLLDRLQRIFPLAAKLDEEIVQEETDILENTILRMLEVMQKVSIFSCEYVKREYFGSFCTSNADDRGENRGRTSPPAGD